MEILRFPIQPDDRIERQKIEMRAGAEVFSVDVLDGQPWLYVRAPKLEKRTETRWFKVRGLGAEDADGTPVGSFHLEVGGIMQAVHVFEEHMG